MDWTGTIKPDWCWAYQKVARTITYRTTIPSTRAPGLIAVLDGLFQQPVTGFAAGCKAPVPAQVPSPGDGNRAGFGVLPGLLVDVREVLVGLRGEVVPCSPFAPGGTSLLALEPRSARRLDSKHPSLSPRGLALATDPRQPLLQCGRVLADLRVGETVQVEQALGYRGPVRVFGPSVPRGRPFVLELADGSILRA